MKSLLLSCMKRLYERYYLQRLIMKKLLKTEKNWPFSLNLSLPFEEILKILNDSQMINGK
jgi:hypothetical protein